MTKEEILQSLTDDSGCEYFEQFLTYVENELGVYEFECDIFGWYYARYGKYDIVFSESLDRIEVMEDTQTLAKFVPVGDYARELVIPIKSFCIIVHNS